MTSITFVDTLVSDCGKDSTLKCRLEGHISSGAHRTKNISKRAIERHTLH